MLQWKTIAQQNCVDDAISPPPSLGGWVGVLEVGWWPSKYYYVAIMNEQFRMSLSHSYGCSWNLQQGKFAEFNSEFLIQFMTHRCSPLWSPRTTESKFILSIFLAAEWNMACLREGELYAERRQQQPTTTIEMPIILQKNFWRSMPMGDWVGSWFRSIATLSNIHKLNRLQLTVRCEIFSRTSPSTAAAVCVHPLVLVCRVALPQFTLTAGALNMHKQNVNVCQE